MGKRLDEYQPVTIDVSKMSKRRLTDAKLRARIDAAIDELKEAATEEAIGRGLLKIAALAAKGAAGA